MQPELAMSSAGGDPTMVPPRHMRGPYGRWEPFAQGTQKAPARGGLGRLGRSVLGGRYDPRLGRPGPSWIVLDRPG